MVSARYLPVSEYPSTSSASSPHNHCHNPSPEDYSTTWMSDETFSSNGDDLLYVMVSLALQSLCYGIYAALMPFFIHILVKKGPHSRLNIFLLYAISFQFIMSTAYWGVKVAELVIKIKGYFIDQPSKDVRALPFVVIWNSFGLLNYVFADGVVVWRAWVLCRQDYGKILIAPIFFLVLTLLSICTTIGLKISTTLYEPALINNICQISNGVWSMLTNMTATAIMIHKAWCYRKIVRGGVRNTHDRRSKAERVLTLLIESGLLYCVSGLGVLTMSAIRLPIGTVADIFLPASYVAAGVYPTIVVVIVGLEQETAFDSEQISAAAACTTCIPNDT